MRKMNNIEKLPEHDEYWHQCQVFGWRDRNFGRLPELEWLYSSLNGVRLTAGLAVKCKRAGLVKGVPDICLPVGRGAYNGLYIELKRPIGGRITEDQARWVKGLLKNGYYARVCRGCNEAINTIEWYLGATNPERLKVEGT